MSPEGLGFVCFESIGSILGGNGTLIQRDSREGQLVQVQRHHCL